MGMQVKSETELGSQNFFIKIHEDIPGGLTFDVTELKAATTYVDPGTIVAIDETTGKCNIVKTAKLQAAVLNNAVKYPVYKNHELKVGDILAYTVGGAAYAITAIDTSNADYDEVTIETTLGVAIAKDAVLYVGKEAGADKGAFKYTAGGVLRDGFKVGQNSSAGVVVKGTVYENRLPFAVHAQMKTDLSGIRFSQSF